MNINEVQFPFSQNLPTDQTKSVKDISKLSVTIKYVVLPVIFCGAGFSVACGFMAYGYRITGVVTVACSVIGSVVATVFNYPKDYSNPKLRIEIIKLLREGSLEEFARAVGNKFKLEDLSEAGFITKDQETQITLTYQYYEELIAELNTSWSCKKREETIIQLDIEDLKSSWKNYQRGIIASSADGIAFDR